MPAIFSAPMKSCSVTKHVLAGFVVSHLRARKKAQRWGTEDLIILSVKIPFSGKHLSPAELSSLQFLAFVI